MQWMTPRNDPQWVSKSADGKYAIAAGMPHEAFRIDALWARPVSIGSSTSITGAQHICEFDAETGTVPA